VAAALYYFFVDNPQSYWEINGLVTYPLEVEATARPYVGAGLTIGRLSTDGEVDGESVASGSESEIGLNALAGVRFPQLSVPLFVEVRLSTLRFVDAAGGESSGIYLTGGFLFGGR